MKKYNLFWISADKQADLLMGQFDSEQEAQEAIPSALAELIAVGATDDEENLRAGTWSIE